MSPTRSLMMAAPVVWLALQVGCGSSSGPMMEQDRVMESPEEEMAAEPMAPPAAVRARPAPRPAAKSEAFADDADGAMGLLMGGSKGAADFGGRGEGEALPPPPPKETKAAGKPGASGQDGPAVREWFPESFLWQPIVETSDAGTAEVALTVPDQLTTWRVLALAHSREGQQAGTVHTFDSRLPLYIDPVVPGWLYSGDRLGLPVQVVNTTSAPVTGALSVETSGALSGGADASVAMSAGGSALEMVGVHAEGSGASRISARLADADAVERVIEVLPEGRPVSSTRGGTLSGPRSFTLEGPEGADPATQELEILVFPGPLAVLQSEVERAGTGGAHPYDPAYSFALAAHLGRLAAQTGNEADPGVIRDLRIVGWQRVVREARSPSAGGAADLLVSLQDVDGHELAEELRDRLVRTVVAGQRADGTWSRQGSGALQLTLAQMAFAVRVLPEDQTGARLRAAGVAERHLDDIDDPYTAALWLASGVIDGSEAEALRKVVLDAVSEDPTGAKTIAVPAAAKNPWGARPSKQEMLAWTSLALADQHLDWHGDLVAELMASYDAAWGFGAGAADAVALEAVTDALPGLDGPAEVTLSLDGEVVGTTTLDPKQPKQPAVLVARPGGDDPLIELTASGATGLAFVATLDSWVPWSGDESLPGVEVEIEADDLRVGEDGVITLRASAPSGVSLVLEQGLVAGVDVDEEATRVRSPGVSTITVTQDRVRLTTRRFTAGEVIEVELVVRPQFAGSFATRPLMLETQGREVALPPFRWDVAG